MQAAAAFVTGISLLVAPAMTTPIGQTPLQLLTTVAALEAQEASIQSGQTLACAALFGAQTVSVGEQVALAWGSVGATSSASSSQSTWTPEGATYVTLSKAGTWTYPFTFYDAGGNSVTCSAKVVVQ